MYRYNDHEPLQHSHTSLEMNMKHPRKSTSADKSFSTTAVFSRMGVAMEELMAATPKMLRDISVDGTQECHGKRKENKKAA